MALTLEEHDAFFVRIIGMIPKELYKHEEEVETASKYHKHKKVALTTDEKKTISKKKKAEKYGAKEEGAGDDKGESPLPGQHRRHLQTRSSLSMDPGRHDMQAQTCRQLTTKLKIGRQSTTDVVP